MSHQDEWGKEICEALVKKSIGVDMTEEMVRLSLGKPNRIEDKEVTSTGKKIRWIYGTPRKGAYYIWFTNGKVSKIEH